MAGAQVRGAAIPPAAAGAAAWVGPVAGFFSRAAQHRVRLDGSLRSLSRVDFSNPLRHETIRPFALALERLGHTPESFALLGPDDAAGEARTAMAMAAALVRDEANAAISRAESRLAEPAGGDPATEAGELLSLLRSRALYQAYMDRDTSERLEGVRVAATARLSGQRWGHIVDFIGNNGDLLLRGVAAPEPEVAMPAQRGEPNGLRASWLSKPSAERLALERAQDRMSAVEARLAAHASMRSAPRASASDLARAERIVAELDRAERGAEYRLPDLFGEKAQLEARGPRTRDPEQVARLEAELAESRELLAELKWATRKAQAQFYALSALSAAERAGVLRPIDADDLEPATVWTRLARRWSAFWGVDQARSQRARDAFTRLATASRSIEEAMRELEQDVAAKAPLAFVEILGRIPDPYAAVAEFSAHFLREDALTGGLKTLLGALAAATERARSHLYPATEDRRTTTGRG